MVEAAELSMRHSGAAIQIDLPPGEQRNMPDRRRTSHGMPWFDGPTTLAGRPGGIDGGELEREPGTERPLGQTSRT
jgi:hypothetical protein